MTTKRTRKNTERQATDSTDIHGLICLRQMGWPRNCTKEHERIQKATQKGLLTTNYYLLTTNSRLTPD